MATGNKKDFCSNTHGGWSRRTFLSGTLGGLLGLFLEPRLSVSAGSLNQKLAPQKRSIIILWMAGGPSHIDTFDPKTDSSVGGIFGRIPTSIPGTFFSDRLPQTAAIANRLTIIRSLSHHETNHFRARYFVNTGYEREASILHPTLGTVTSKMLGDEQHAIPSHVSILDPGLGPGFLGDRYAPLYIANPDDSIPDVRPAEKINDRRFQSRLALVQELEKRSPIPAVRDRENIFKQLRQRTVSLMRSPDLRTFDLTEEPEQLRDDYGRNPFGQGCLLARRLVEAGIRCVEVTSKGWDTHDDNFTKNEENLNIFDPALASLVLDLETRNELESTLVVAVGEFGRTPEINKDREGRDHHPHAFSAVLAGGGLPGGLVLGATDEMGSRVVKDPITIPDLTATLCLRLGIDPSFAHKTKTGRLVRITSEGTPIPILSQG